MNEYLCDRLTSGKLRLALGNVPVGDVFFYPTVNSTNDAAFAEAQNGAPDLSVFTALEQTAGRGRMDRKWVAKPGDSLILSVLIRPTEAELSQSNLFAPLMGLAAAAAIEKCCGVSPQIKWPNDLLLNRKKVSGILCEMRWAGSQVLGPVLGIGINLKKGSAPLLPGLVYPASSIEDEGGLLPSMEELIAEILNGLNKKRPLLGTDGFIREWNERLAYKDEPAMFTSPEQPPRRMIVRGVDGQGNLIAETESGERIAFQAGEISLRPLR